MTTTPITPVTMPKFGLAMTEGKVAAWTVPEGMHVNVGDELADIETTKITSAYESPASGVLRRHVAREQEDLPVGALIGVIAPENVSDAEIDAFIARFTEAFATAQAASSVEAAPEPSTLSAGGRTIRYQEAGNAQGPPVLLIHGFGGDLNNWLFNQPVLAVEHKTYALDLPGHGGSQKQVGAGDLASLNEALVQFMVALGITRAHLIGHSLGGAVALLTALREPTRVASLSLICPAGFGRQINAGFIDGFLKAKQRKQFQSVLEQLFTDPRLVSREMIDGLQRFKRLDGAVTALSAIAAANFPGGSQAISLRDQISKLNIPILVIWGAEDRIIPASQAEGLPPMVRTHILPGTGHMPHLEKASEVNRLIAEMVHL
jgi:pyruvate dehydrogenase E2 component (dihydrolipoamide acetyltransferase)